MKTQVLYAGICILGLSSAVPGFAQDAPEYFEISNVMVNGGGCPPGSVQKNIAADRKSFSLRFDDYVAEIGPAFTLIDSRKNCQLTVNLNIPPGWRFAVASFDYRGALRLDRGIQAEHTTSYYFQATELTPSFNSKIVGPENRPFHFNEKVVPSNALWSSCEKKRALNINTVLRLTNLNSSLYKNAEGSIGTDTISGHFQSQEWKLIWAKCP